jgi:hypothetical protein
MPYDLHDTICAIGTAAGGAARGMVRVSGPSAVEVVGRLFQPRDGSSLGDMHIASAIAGDITIALAGEELRSLPCDVFLWPTSRSYTRESVAELHTFGSPPLLEALIEALCRAGARLAEPGEFTLRSRSSQAGYRNPCNSCEITCCNCSPSWKRASILLTKILNSYLPPICWQGFPARRSCWPTSSGR